MAKHILKDLIEEEQRSVLTPEQIMQNPLAQRTIGNNHAIDTQGPHYFSKNRYTAGKYICAGVGHAEFGQVFRVAGFDKNLYQFVEHGRRYTVVT